MHVQRSAPGGRRITRFNRDARAAASRFAGPNSQDSPSLDEKDSGSLIPRQRSTGPATLPAESTWRQDVRDQYRACTPPPQDADHVARSAARGQRARATPHRPLLGDIRSALEVRTDPVSSRFRHLAVFETPNGKASDLHRLAGSLDALIGTGRRSAPNKSRHDLIVC